MSLPMILSMMVTSLYNIIDSFFVAKISEDAMTALSLVFPIQNFINAVTIGFSIGINAVISYYLGAQNKRAADHAAALGLILNTFMESSCPFCVSGSCRFFLRCLQRIRQS